MMAKTSVEGEVNCNKENEKKKAILSNKVDIFFVRRFHEVNDLSLF